jgi:subtilisin family serine protease
VIRVALLDSGVAERHAGRVAAARAFRLEPHAGSSGGVGGESGEPPAARLAIEDGIAGVTRETLGHGPALADALLADARAELVVARVFFAALATSATQLAAALDWAVEQGAALANVSAGLRDDRVVLAAAVERAQSHGVLVVAASPARGAGVFPAAYPGVVRATGDARCALGEWSWLASGQADFGAHVRAGAVQGASAGCAHVSARLAALLADGATPEQALIALRERAHYVGPEQRVGR